MSHKEKKKHTSRHEHVSCFVLSFSLRDFWRLFLLQKLQWTCKLDVNQFLIHICWKVETNVTHIDRGRNLLSSTFWFMGFLPNWRNPRDLCIGTCVEDWLSLTHVFTIPTTVGTGSQCLTAALILISCDGQLTCCDTVLECQEVPVVDAAPKKKQAESNFLVFSSVCF